MSDFQPGARVLRYRDHHDCDPRAETVVRVTKTTVTLTSGERFTADGQEWGNSNAWGHHRIELAPTESLPAAQADHDISSDGHDRESPSDAGRQVRTLTRAPARDYRFARGDGHAADAWQCRAGHVFWAERNHQPLACPDCEPLSPPTDPRAWATPEATARIEAAVFAAIDADEDRMAYEATLDADLNPEIGEDYLDFVREPLATIASPDPLPDELVSAATSAAPRLPSGPGAMIFQHWLRRRESFLAMFAAATQSGRQRLAQRVARYLAPLYDLPATHWLAVWERCIAPDWAALLHDDPPAFHARFDALDLGNQRACVVMDLADRLGATPGDILLYLGASRARCAALGMLATEIENAAREAEREPEPSRAC